MPYSKMSELPQAVQKLPDVAARQWMHVFNSALAGDTCKGDESCAFAQAWSVIGKEYEKRDDSWIKKQSEVVEFDLTITKATYDTTTGVRRFYAVASDTLPDSFEEAMTLSLFQDFIDRASRKETPPARYRSNFWSGGLPYLSVAHYFDLEGKGAAGTVTSLYVDGGKLKAKGEFSDTSLGIAAYEAVKKSIKDIPEHLDDQQKKIRISIAFLDYAHQHGDNPPYIRSLSGTFVPCTYCEKGVGDVQYLQGLLIHLALTRVPVNTRTDIIGEEVSKSMSKITTRKEDAASIVGDELASELETESKLVGRSETEADSMVVVKSDEEITEEVAEVIETSVAETPEVVDVSATPTLESLVSAIAELRSMIEKAKKPKEDESVEEPMGDDADETDQTMKDHKKKHPAMMKSIIDFVTQFDVILESGLQGEALLMQLQEPFGVFGESVKSYVANLSQGSPVPETKSGLTLDDVRKAMSDALAPLVIDVALLKTQVGAFEQVKLVQNSASAPIQPPHRALTGASLPAEVRSTLQGQESGASQGTPNRPLTMKEIARRSVGLG